MIINPPFQAPDEDSHLYKMYGITNGSWNFKKYTTNNINGIDLGSRMTFSGQILPLGLVQASRYNKRITFKPQMKTSFQETIEIASIPLNKNQEIFIGYPVPSYTPVSYIPAIFFVFLLKVISAAPIWMLYISRLCSLITYTALCYFAIKVTPVKKWMFLTICLMPMCLYEASALSTDALSNGTAFLFSAYALYLAFDENIKHITKKHLLIFFFLITLLSVCKFAYFFLIFMYFLIPKEKFISNQKRLFYFGIFFLISAAACALPVLYYLQTVNGLQTYSSTLDKGELAKSIFVHPIKYLWLILKSLVYNLKFYINGFTALFGWSDTYIPFYAVMTYLFAVFLSALVNYKEKTINLCIKHKLLFLSIITAVFLLIMTSCYINFMPDDYTKTITGVQGRYFLPLAPLLFLLFYNKKIHFRTKLFEYLIIFLINFVLFISLIRIVYRFYI